MFKNNYLSLWIGNLGVDPLLAIAFFLLRPAFFSLNFLLTLVCVVLDAIILSLNFIINSLFRSDKLTILLLLVKVFMTQTAIADSKLDKDIFLSRGEQMKVEINHLNKFSIGNKEVISVTYKGKSLYIKGKRVGFSDALLVTKEGTKKLKIFVLTKREQLKKARIAKTLKDLGLNIKLDGQVIRVKGVIETVSAYQVFNKLSSQIDSQKIIDVKLTNELRNKVIENIYNETYQAGAKLASCENIDYKIFCYFKGLDIKSARAKYIIEKYAINLTSHPSIKSDLNYVIKYKIFKINESNSRVRDLGPSRISLGLIDILKNSANSLIEGDTVEIKDTDSTATVVAQPETLLTLNNQSALNLGGEFPVITTNSIGQNTQWKFYGLKVKSKIQKVSNRLLLSFNTFLSTPFEQNINSTSGDSTVFVTPNKYIKLFQIGFNQKKISKESIPWINKIPILRHLFERNSNSSTFQKIICYIKIEVSNE